MAWEVRAKCGEMAGLVVVVAVVMVAYTVVGHIAESSRVSSPTRWVRSVQ
mgnify:CR=1 FL=1